MQNSTAKHLLEDEQSPNYLDIDQLIDYLPNRPVKPSVYRLVSEKKIPYYKLGGKLFFDQAEIDAWIRSKRQVALNQAEEGELCHI